MDIKLFKPYKLQQEFISEYADTEDLFGVVVAPRGSGKTMLGLNLMLYWLLQKPNRKGGWISPVYSQAKSVLDQIVETSKPIITTSNRMEATIQFINGSTLKFLSSDTPDNIRGFRFTHLVLDETAFIKEQALGTAILPTLNPSGKKCLMISTPKGKNHFYNWWMKDDVVKKRFPLTQCPYVSDQLIEESRRSLPPDLFRQEFEAQFVDSSNDVFIGTEKVSVLSEWDIRKQDAFIGIDTGLSDDMSVLACISPTGKVLYIDYINKVNLNVVAKRFISKMKQYNIVGGFIESNGIGRGMVDLVAPHFVKVRPFFTTQQNKTEIVRKLIHDIETMQVELPSDKLCPQLHSELASYTYSMSPNGLLTFKHTTGTHDDFVDALLLANYSRARFMDRGTMTVKGSQITEQKSRFKGRKLPV